MNYLSFLSYLGLLGVYFSLVKEHSSHTGFVHVNPEGKERQLYILKYSGFKCHAFSVKYSFAKEEDAGPLSPVFWLIFGLEALHARM